MSVWIWVKVNESVIVIWSNIDVYTNVAMKKYCILKNNIHSANGYCGLL